MAPALLLDSQVVLWLLQDDRRIGERARTLIKGAAFVHVSAASVWELTIKALLGKLSIPENLAEHLSGQGLTELPISVVHAEAIRTHPELLRHDPFDRLLLAQAVVEGMTFLTADRVLLDLDYANVQDACT